SAGWKNSRTGTGAGWPGAPAGVVSAGVAPAVLAAGRASTSRSRAISGRMGQGGGERRRIVAAPRPRHDAEHHGIADNGRLSPPARPAPMNTAHRKPLPGTSLHWFDAREAVEARWPGAWAGLPYVSRVLAENLVRRCPADILEDCLRQLVERKRERDLPWFPA